MRKNDIKVVTAVAEAAGLPTNGFLVEEQDGIVLVNHPDSMTWTPEVRAKVKAAAERTTGGPASVT